MRSAFLLASVLIAGCGLHGHHPATRHEPAKPATPAPGLEEPGEIVAPGLVESWGGNVLLSPQETGQISRLLVEEGDKVAAGQLLAVLDDGAQRAEVEVAKAGVAEAEAAWAKVTHGATAEELREARAVADGDAARAEFARASAYRAVRLGETQTIARAEVERADAELGAQFAVARVSAARLASAIRGARAEDRSATRARLFAARARLQAAEAALSRRQVIAPEAATVLLSQLNAGELFTPGGAAMFVLGDLSRLRIRMEVDEVDAMRIPDGARCVIYGDDAARIAEGNVFRIAPRMGRRGLAIESPTARADVRVREVFVEVPATAGLIPGQRVWGHTAPRLAVAAR